MELALLAGAVYGGIYAVLSSNKKPGPQQQPLLQPPNTLDAGVQTTLSIRTRIDDAIGSGAEIGAAPFDEGQDPMALLADQTAAIDRPNVLPVPPQPGPEPQPMQPVPRPIELGPAAPLQWPEPSADPNALAPGVVTVLPVKRYPLPEMPPPAPASSSVVRPVPDQDGPGSTKLDLAKVDLSAMADDARRRRAQLTSAAPGEPADNVVHAAAAVQAAVVASVPKLTADQRAGAAIQAAQSAGTLVASTLTKPNGQADIDSARTAYVANGGRYGKLSAAVWRQILAYKLGCDGSDRQLGPLVTKLRASA